MAWPAIASPSSVGGWTFAGPVKKREQPDAMHHANFHELLAWSDDLKDLLRVTFSDSQAILQPQASQCHCFAAGPQIRKACCCLRLVADSQMTAKSSCGLERGSQYKPGMESL